MSDFDKEAEREKLREKFDRDEEKRADTQRMSELLLKGATMTNKHCNRCGDPLFRYDGQTFCSSCQVEEAAAQGDQQAAAQNDQRAATGETAHQSQSPQADADGVESTHTSTESTGSQTATAQPQAGSQAGRSPATSLDKRAQKTTAGVAVDDATGASTGDTGDLTAARGSLRRTVRRFAQQAEGTEDPRRARELLAAAREAAATLAELE